MANKTAEEILEDLAPSHEDGDHEVCASNFSICQVCGRKEYFMNIAFHPCTHTAVSRWVPQKCDCHVGKDIAAASRQLFEAEAALQEPLYRQVAGKPYATDGFKGSSNIYYERVDAIPIDKLRAFYGITVTEEEAE